MVIKVPTIPSVQWLRKHILFPKPLGLYTFLRSVKAFAISFRFICRPQVFHCHGNYCKDQNEADPDSFIHPPKTPSISLVFYGFELLILSTRQTLSCQSHVQKSKKPRAATHLWLHGFTLSLCATLLPPCTPCMDISIQSALVKMWRSVVGNRIRKSSDQDYELH